MIPHATRGHGKQNEPDAAASWLDAKCSSGKSMPSDASRGIAAPGEDASCHRISFPPPVQRCRIELLTRVMVGSHARSGKVQCSPAVCRGGIIKSLISMGRVNAFIGQPPGQQGADDKYGRQVDTGNSQRHDNSQAGDAAVAG